MEFQSPNMKKIYSSLKHIVPNLMVYFNKKEISCQSVGKSIPKVIKKIKL